MTPYRVVYQLKRNAALREYETLAVSAAEAAVKAEKFANEPIHVVSVGVM